MSDALEQAAQAFDTAMGNSQPAARAPSSDNSGPVESLFGDNLGVLEIDDESPAKGGGDDDLPSRVKPEVRKQTRAEADEDEPDLGDDADPEEGEGDEDADPDADDADGEGDEEDEGDAYEVMVDGEAVIVPLREALDGYMRMETFHRRLNGLNEVKVALHNESVKVIEKSKRYTSMIDDLQTHLDQLIPAEPNWDEEYARDPAQARLMQKKYEEVTKTRATLEAEKARVTKEMQEQEEAERQDYIVSENEKIRKNNPTWKDEKVMKRDLQSMLDTGTRAGFTEEEVRNVYDSRYVTILLKAAKYDRMQAAKPKPVPRGTKPTKPGAGSTRTAPKGSQAMKNLSRTGSVDAAAAVFGELISPKSRRR